MGQCAGHRDLAGVLRVAVRALGSAEYAAAGSSTTGCSVDGGAGGRDVADRYVGAERRPGVGLRHSGRTFDVGGPPQVRPDDVPLGTWLMMLIQVGSWAVYDIAHHYVTIMV